MTTRNNFDKSSTGVDISCSVYYDTDSSQRDFRENFESVQSDGYRTTSIQYYIDNGNVEGKDSVKFTVKGSVQDIIAAAKQYTYAYADLVSASGKELEEVKAELIAQFEDVNLISYAMGTMPKIDGLEFVPNKNLIVTETRGYSQGDYAKVIYCPDDLKAVWGNEPKEEELQKMFDHYFWDAPIYAQVEIDGKEYSYWDMPDYDSYEWDRKKFIDYLVKESRVKAEQLESVIPDQPSY